jgi:hypothetical protein
MAGLVIMFQKGIVEVYESHIQLHRIACGHRSDICLFCT